MSYQRSSTAEVITQTPIPVGAERFARRSAMEHAPWLSGNKAVASSDPNNPLGLAQHLITIIRPAPVTVHHITIVASDQAAQLQSP
jgi:hypothetical protein